MIDLLKNKKAIFFDVGYTLDYPASGDWMFTRKFYEIAGEQVDAYSKTKIQEALDKSFEYLEKNHLVKSVEAELEQFIHFYRELSHHLNLKLTELQIKEIAQDKTYNMDNYVTYPDVINTLKELRKTHKLGVISDTWPSIDNQLQTLGILKYFSTCTYSCNLGIFKPDKRMYQDALNKMNALPNDTVFIDDRLQNLQSAAELGITPILIAANPASDIEVPFLKIHSIRELL